MQNANEGTRRAWLKPRLQEGSTVVGSFLDIPHPAAVEVMARSRLDFVLLDGEHGALGVAMLPSLVAAAEVHGVPALIRVPGVDPAAIAYALDAGAAGIVVPRINSADEARAVVSAARYPPAGARGVGPGRAAGYGLDMPAYLAEARTHTLVAIQIETRLAVERLDDILDVPGVDLIFVGPADLSASLGYKGATDPELQPVIELVLERAARAGRWTGVFAPDPGRGRHWLARHINLLALSSDLLLMASGTRAALKALREATPP